MLEIMNKLLMKNRTIVSNDIQECMDIIKTKYPLVLNKFPTGGDYQTWLIPPSGILEALCLRQEIR